MNTYELILKTIENELIKCNDGTNLAKILPQLDNIAPKIRNKKREQSYVLDENGEIVQHKRGSAMGVEIDTEELIEKGYTNLHITHNHPCDLTLDDIPTTFSDADMEMFLHRDPYGTEYTFRSISAEDPNGSRITLIKNNDFSMRDEMNFRKAFQKYSEKSLEYNTLVRENTEKLLKDEIKRLREKDPYAPINHLLREVDIRKKVIKDMGSLNNYLKKEGVLKDFEDSNCKFRVTRNTVDWEKPIREMYE